MDISRVDLNLLATLKVLLEERNVTRAARRLHISQPGMSAQLARLRTLFGDPLDMKKKAPQWLPRTTGDRTMTEAQREF